MSLQDDLEPRGRVEGRDSGDPGKARDDPLLILALRLVTGG